MSDEILKITNKKYQYDFIITHSDTTIRIEKLNYIRIYYSTQNRITYDVRDGTVSYHNYANNGDIILFGESMKIRNEVLYHGNKVIDKGVDKYLNKFIALKMRESVFIN